MNPRLSYCLGLLLLSLTTYAQKDLKESCQLTAPVVIDGNVAEWGMEYIADSKGKYMYNVCNDDVNLYIRLKISDNLIQYQTGVFGLTLFLRPNMKKSKMGLRYPLAKDPEEMKRENKGKEGMPVNEMKRELLKDVEVVELLGFQKEPIMASRLGLKNGIEVKIVDNELNEYVYEAKIPFKAFRFDKSKLKSFELVFETGRLVQANAYDKSSHAPGRSSRGMPYGYGAYGGQGFGSSVNFAAHNELSLPSRIVISFLLK